MGRERIPSDCPQTTKQVRMTEIGCVFVHQTKIRMREDTKSDQGAVTVHKVLQPAPVVHSQVLDKPCLQKQRSSQVI